MRHIPIPAGGDLRQIAIYILSLNVAKGKDIVAYCREISLLANAVRHTGSAGAFSR
jgi:hypothetical protein